MTVKNRQNHGVVLKKWGKSRQNHGVRFTAQYTLIESLFYCISVTNYHCSHAAPFGASRRRILKYYRMKKNAVKIEHYSKFSLLPVGRCCTAYDRSYATFDSTLIYCYALVCHMTHSSPVHRNSATSEMTLDPDDPAYMSSRNITWVL